jgi:hypothetical protein
LTPALVGGEWSASRPGRFTPGKELPVPIYRRLGGPQSRSGNASKCTEVKIVGLQAENRTKLFLNTSHSSIHSTAIFRNIVYSPKIRQILDPVLSYFNAVHIIRINFFKTILILTCHKFLFDPSRFIPSFITNVLLIIMHVL